MKNRAILFETERKANTGKFVWDENDDEWFVNIIPW